MVKKDKVVVPNLKMTEKMVKNLVFTGNKQDHMKNSPTLVIAKGFEVLSTMD